MASNPFRFHQILGAGDPYCRRPDLERLIVEGVEANRRLVLLGDRRNGKSSLVEHTLAEQKEHVVVTVDFHGLTSVADLVERMRYAIEDALHRERTLTKHLPASVLAALEAVSGIKIHMPMLLEVTVSPTHATTLVELMRHIGRVSEWRPTTLFLDEFQEIPDKLGPHTDHVLGVLRGAIQRQPNTSYIFAGSAKDSMADMFTSSTSPFYKGALPIEVGPIPRSSMEPFLARLFETGERVLDREAMDAVFLLAGQNPNDLQEFCYHIWSRSVAGKVGRDQIRDAFATLMSEMGLAGERILGDATPNQRRFLFAAALSASEFDVFTAKFAELGGFAKPQSVDRALGAFTSGKHPVLENRGGRVHFRERFMRLWLLGSLLRNPGMFPPVATYASDWINVVRPYLAPDVTHAVKRSPLPVVPDMPPLPQPRQNSGIGRRR